MQQLKFPKPPTSNDQVVTWLGLFLNSLNRVLPFVMVTNEVNSRLMLTSPNGTTYFVTVRDDGTLETQSGDGLPANL